MLVVAFLSGSKPIYLQVSNVRAQLKPHESIRPIRLHVHEGAHGHQLGPRHVVQRQIVLLWGEDYKMEA